ncbi:MAG: tetratricopeptide repeat protein [Sedimentisphaerales bacterium]|nr:tetratricopeptide repeat protein [Sedimentisphaerales bacterium]
MREFKRQNTEYSKPYIVKYKNILFAGFFLIFPLLFCVSAYAKNLSKTELEYWNSPEFQKRFADSYIAETDIEPKLKEDEYKKMMKIRELIESDKMDEAVKTLEKEINEFSSPVFDFTLANIYFQKDNLEKAASYYEKSVSKYNKFRRAWKNLGLVHIRSGEFEKAIPALTKVLELGGSDVITYAQLGYAYLSVENNLCAESAYRMAVLLDPQTTDWKTGLATSVLKQQRYAEAVALLDNLIVAEPNKTDLWLYQANAYIGLNQPLKAAVNFELIDQMGKSTVSSLTRLGDIYVNQELYETAVNSYIRAIEKESKDSTEQANHITHFIRAAKVLTANGAFEDTQRLIEKIEIKHGESISNADRNDLLKLRAQIAMAQGADEEQAKILEEIVAIDPLDGQALILLGQYCGRSGDFEKAVFYYERAENLEKFEADAKVRHGQLLVKQEKYNEALPLLRSAISLKPRDDVQKYLEQVERFAKSR